MTSLFKLLLRAKLARMSTLPLPTVSGPGRKPGITLTTNSLLAVKLLRQKRQRGVIDAPTQTKNQVQSRLLLDVVVAQGASIFELFTGEDETLLIRGDSLLVLDFGLDIVDGVGGLDIQGDGFTGEGFHENL